MGTLINGKWEINPVNSSVKNGEFIRQKSSFRNSISPDSKFTAKKDRYHLYISHACPWAHRTLIVRALKGLENVIPVSVVSPKMGAEGWSFIDEYQGATGDPINNAKHVKDLYLKADPEYTGKATVPILWDKELKTIVNNESSEIIRIFNSSFNDLARNPELDLYPEKYRAEIDEINAYVYDRINNGVYKSGFATSQEAYEKNVKALFEALDYIEAKLENKNYLVGDQLTEADIRLFVTLIRFDIVYYSHFKTNLKMIRDYKNIHRQVLDIYSIPEIKSTVNFDHIKTHYYWSQESINPTRVVPIGPEQVI